MDDCSHAALLAAVRASDVRRVAVLARECAKNGTIDERANRPNSESPTAVQLRAAPHVVSTYLENDAVLEHLLTYMSADQIDERSSGWCFSGCETCAPTALHLAVAGGSADCVLALLRAGADTTLASCVRVAPHDEPTDRSGDGGIATCTALQIGRRRNSECCTLLLEHGASPAAHRDSECPVCYESLVDVVEPIATTPCGHRHALGVVFELPHAHAL
jgi:hypothetical protein